MVEAPSLAELRELLRRALEMADAIGDGYVGALVDTALQAVEMETHRGSPKG